MPNPSIRDRRLMCVSVLLLGVLWVGAAEGELTRDCRDLPLPSKPTLPVDALRFDALTEEHLRQVAVSDAPVDQKLLQAPFEQGGRFNELEGGAVVAVVTKQRRPAKLVLTVSGSALTVRDLTTYAANGGNVVRGASLSVADGGGVDLDRGRVVTDAGEADLRWIRRTGRLILTPANGARFAVLVPRIVVPLTAHFMTQRGGALDPQVIMPIDALTAMFAPAGDFNRIWERAGLLFVVARSEACTYSVRDFLPERSEPEPDGVPAPGGDCRALFRRINAVYDSPIDPRVPADGGPAYGADLYLWIKVGWDDSSKLFGYGVQHRADGPNHGLGALWVNAARCRVEGPGCGSRLAHEIGHFLGLCHSCFTEVTLPSERGACGFCTSVPACTAGQRDLLMRDDAAGEQLTTGEVGQARQKALEHRWRNVSQ